MTSAHSISVGNGSYAEHRTRIIIKCFLSVSIVWRVPLIKKLARIRENVDFWRTPCEIGDTSEGDTKHVGVEDVNHFKLIQVNYSSSLTGCSGDV
jgi:hypothetical protein